MSSILLVDDDEEIRKLWEFYLAPFQSEIFHATNGVEALYLAQYHKPVLVILDLMMPMASGDLVLGFIRSTASIKDTPVLVISAHQNLASLAQQYEADAYLQKPVLMADFRQMVAHLLGSPH